MSEKLTAILSEGHWIEVVWNPRDEAIALNFRDAVEV